MERCPEYGHLSPLISLAYIRAMLSKIAMLSLCSLSSLNANLAVRDERRNARDYWRSESHERKTAAAMSSSRCPVAMLSSQCASFIPCGRACVTAGLYSRCDTCADALSRSKSGSGAICGISSVGNPRLEFPAKVFVKNYCARQQDHEALSKASLRGVSAPLVSSPSSQ